MKAKKLLAITVVFLIGYLAAVLVSKYTVVNNQDRIIPASDAKDNQDGTILSHYARDNKKRKMEKWSNYFKIYERHFSRFRNTEVNILEIGVSEGGSLQMWKEYFGPKANIYGIDIDPLCKKVEEPQIKVFIGDQSDRNFLSSFKRDVPKLDIVIDDGGHTMAQQKISFEELYPHLSENGVYIVEDTHTSYWPRYGGGYHKDGTFIEMTKGLIDDLHAWHSKDRALQVSDMTRSLYSLHIYNSVVVFEKRKVGPANRSKSGLISLN